MSAPLAIIKVDGRAIGKMKDIRINENIRRMPVRGLGSLTPKEFAPLEWEGTLTCSSYLVQFVTSLIPGAINRVAQTVDEWAMNVLLQEDGLTLDIYHRVATGAKNANGNRLGKLELFVSVPGMFMNSESMNISEGQIGGHDQSFQYINPILHRV